MISLILTISCSTSIALILKHNDTKKGDALILLMGNYFVAALISLIFVLTNSSNFYSSSTLIFGLILGAFFVLAFFAFAKAVGSAGTALATVSSRLSLIVPITFSILLYGEQPGTFQIAGFLFSLVTIFFFYTSLKRHTLGNLKFIDYFYLLLVLFGIGLNDFAMKIFQQWRGNVEKPFFLFIIFGSAFIYTAAILLLRKKSVDKRTFLYGAILGVPNMFSSFFLIGALDALPAIFVYPVVNIGIIIATALLALMIWREKLNAYGILALGSGIIAIIFLSV